MAKVLSEERRFSPLEKLIILIVLLIIITVTFASLEGVKRAGRDTKRKGDILALQQAFEKYHEEYGDYGSGSCKEMDKYIKGFYPEDPIGLPKHSEYVENCSDDDYCICTKLERSRGGNSPDDECTFIGNQSNSWYCVANLN